METTAPTFMAETCKIELSPDDEFVYRHSWWSRRHHINGIRMHWDHFEMFSRDKHGTMQPVSRSSKTPHFHFFFANEIPNMPAHIRAFVDQQVMKLNQAQDYVPVANWWNLEP
ncbi:MAG: hypothetical protein WAQ27_00465 [Candidatus Microsaccharimonas sp.]